MSEWIPPIRALRIIHTAPINDASPVHKAARIHVERLPEGQVGHTPSSVELTEFEKHYARAFPRLDDGKGFLTYQDLHTQPVPMMGQTDDDEALVRTLRDYSVAAREHGTELFYKRQSLIERTETTSLLGSSRVHETEVPLSHHMHALSQLYNQEYRYDVFFEEYVDEFADWDHQSGQKGYLVADDIDRLMDDPLIRGDSATALATLKEMLRGGVEPGQSLVFHPRSIHRILDDGTQLKANYVFNQRLLLSNTWRQKKALLAASVRDVFENGIPDWHAVTQSGFSDCYGEACLAAYAHQDQYAVRDMILPGQVRFGNGSVVTVSAPTDAQLVVYASSTSDGMWATVIDKAWRQLPVRTLAVLTGRSSRIVRAPMDVDLVRKILQLCVPQRGVAVIGMGTGKNFQYQGVLDYQAESDTITLRNPWSPGKVYESALSPLVERIAILEADVV